VNRTRTYWNAGSRNGQFILTTRAAYDAVGTHAAVKHSVADDVVLAQNYVRAAKTSSSRSAGVHDHTDDGSLREIIGGWTKNLASGAPLMAPPISVVRALAAVRDVATRAVLAAPPICG